MMRARRGVPAWTRSYRTVPDSAAGARRDYQGGALGRHPSRLCPAAIPCRSAAPSGRDRLAAGPPGSPATVPRPAPPRLRGPPARHRNTAAPDLSPGAAAGQLGPHGQRVPAGSSVEGGND
jgi:hypothetical protein